MTKSFFNFILLIGDYVGIELYIGIIVLVVFLLIIFRVLKTKNNNNTITDNKDTFTLYLNNNGLSENDVDVIFIVEDCFKVSGRNLVTGAIIKGSINVGDTLKYTNKDGSIIETTILGIEKFRQRLQTANTGDNIGMEINNSEKINKGTYLFRKI